MGCKTCFQKICCCVEKRISILGKQGDPGRSGAPSSSVASFATTSLILEMPVNANINIDNPIGSAVLAKSGKIKINVNIADFALNYLTPNNDINTGLFELKIQVNALTPVTVWRKSIANLDTSIKDLIDADAYIDVASAGSTITILASITVTPAFDGDVTGVLGIGKVIIWNNAF